MFYLIVAAVGLATLLLDGKRYKQIGYMKELLVVKIIAYTYMTIGFLMYIILFIIDIRRN